jgi:hypothetical protein
MRFFLRIIFPFFSFVACSQNIKLNQPTDLQSSSTVRVTILSQTSLVAADGLSDLTVQIHVDDLLGNVVNSYKTPTQVSSGLGVNYANCTLTNSAGNATCIYRATIDGIKNILIGQTELQISFVTSSEQKGSLFAVVPSAQSKVSAGTDEVRSTVGATVDSPRQQTSSGVVYTDISIQQ